MNHQICDKFDGVCVLKLGTVFPNLRRKFENTVPNLHVRTD
jgi:hypothetical protein